MSSKITIDDVKPEVLEYLTLLYARLSSINEMAVEVREYVRQNDNTKGGRISLVAVNVLTSMRELMDEVGADVYKLSSDGEWPEFEGEMPSLAEIFEE